MHPRDSGVPATCPGMGAHPEETQRSSDLHQWLVRGAPQVEGEGRVADHRAPEWCVRLSGRGQGREEIPVFSFKSFICWHLYLVLIHFDFKYIKICKLKKKARRKYFNDHF